MTQFKDRCGDCQHFPGNGKRCKDEDEPQRKKIYALDMKCGNFKMDLLRGGKIAYEDTDSMVIG